MKMKTPCPNKLSVSYPEVSLGAQLTNNRLITDKLFDTKDTLCYIKKTSEVGTHTNKRLVIQHSLCVLLKSNVSEYVDTFVLKI